MTKNLPRVVTKNLAICKRAIDGGAHGAEIALSDLGVDRRAGKLTVRQGDSRRLGRGQHVAQELCADLMAEAAGAAMDGDHGFVELQSELARDILVEDLGDRLHLEIMVTRPERAHLAALAFLG